MATETQVHDPQTYAIIGAAIEVHRVLGAGFLEAVYQESLALEFAQGQIPFAEKIDILVRYKGKVLECTYVPDFICFGDIVVELKALDALAGPQRAQLLNYLKATSHYRGLLLNFGSERLAYERFAFGEPPGVQERRRELSTDGTDSTDGKDATS